MLSKRSLLQVSLQISALTWVGLATGTSRAMAAQQAPVPSGPFPVMRTEQQWRAMLTSLQYMVMREGFTEPAFLNSAHIVGRDNGVYVCVGCGQPLVSSKTKFEARSGPGVGWPGFWAAPDGSFGKLPDDSNAVHQTALHCTRCGSHHGHLYDNGPTETHLHYCLNGSCLRLVEA